MIPLDPYRELFCRVFCEAAEEDPVRAVLISGHDVTPEEAESIAADYLSEQRVRNRLVQYKRTLLRLRIDCPQSRAELAARVSSDVGDYVESTDTGLRVKPLDQLAPEKLAGLREYVVGRRSGLKCGVLVAGKLEELEILGHFLGLFRKDIEPLEVPTDAEVDQELNAFCERLRDLAPVVH